MQNYAHTQRTLDPIRALRISDELHAKIMKHAADKFDEEFSRAARDLIERGLVVAAAERERERDAAKAKKSASLRTKAPAKKPAKKIAKKAATKVAGGRGRK